MDITSFLLGYESGKTTGGGGSGGGGSLPAGLYWTGAGIKNATDYYQQFPFTFKGELYCFKGLSGTGSASSADYLCYDICKYTDGAWTTVVSKAKNSTGNIRGVEFNGKVHFINEYKTHYIFDGTTYTTAANLPVYSTDTGGSVAFVHNGVLKFSTYKGAVLIYAWDEATDTWTEECQIASGESYSYFYNFFGVVDGEAYFQMKDASTGKYNIYRYTGSSHELVCEDIGYSGFSEMFAYDGCLYGTYYGNKTTPSNVYSLAKFDPTDGTFTILGALPWANSLFFAVEYGGKAIFSSAKAGINHTFSNFMQFHEVKE